MTRYCSRHRGWVLASNAQVISSREVGSGAPQPIYACHPCIRAEGIVPPRRASRGRRDPSPQQ